MSQENNRQEFLVFTLGPRRAFAITTLKVREIVTTRQFNQIPGSHPSVVGTMPLRGHTLTVIDLANAIGMASDECKQVVVCEVQERLYGLLVTGIDTIHYCNSDDVASMPSRLGDTSYSSGVIRRDNDLVQVLDLERILNETVGLNARQDNDNFVLDDTTLAEIRGQRILICDDSRFARRQLANVLEQHGIDYHSAPNGRAALERLQEQAAAGEPIQILVSDIEMPELDGYQLATTVRSEACLKETYIILHTSLNSDVCRRYTHNSGADEGLCKFDPEALLAAIARGSHH
ncbi:response regulator receiver modulated CheW protein [Ferrimonas sediminum]|uniref:Response regulator receiver modulated CheW protein n=1 Tax=Ferrimonas sediminum TaxID=718193 RepID=A0A1G8XJI6_9GAMM|nr:chemotaxis protein [Ferrimonas sediminum]SDJ90778.1 response regulator receiver modulated CheW protein [Ferrimonas sediminum]